MDNPGKVPAPQETAKPAIKILMVEDVPTDAELAARELKRAGIDHYSARVDTRSEFLKSLSAFAPDIILSDFSMPHFDGLTALALAQMQVPDTPFIFVSATIGEEIAIDSLKRGATDYILKNNMARLGPAVLRALKDRSELAAKREAEAALRETQQRFELFMRHLPGAAFMKDRTGRYCYVNGTWEKLTGKTSAEVLGKTDPMLWPDTAVTFQHNDNRVIDTNQPIQVFETFKRPDGVHTYLVNKFPIPDPKGQPILIGGVAVDFTERLRADEKIARLSRIHKVLSGINSTIVRIRNRNELFAETCRIAVENGGFKLAWIGLLEPKTMAMQRVAWFGQNEGFLDMIRISAREDLPEGQGIVGSVIRTGKPVVVNDISADARMRLATESIKRGYHAAIGLPLKVEGETIASMTIYAGTTGFFDQEELKLLNELAGDISFALEHIAKEEKLHYLAYYDALTGLPNRELLLTYLGRVTRRANEDKSKAAVMICNIQRFSHINETLGRQAGDTVLREVGRRLKRIWPEPDNIARLTADSFAGIVAGIRDASEMAHLFEQSIAGELSQPIDVGSEKLRISITAGIAVSPSDGEDADALLKNAEASLKNAKASGEKYLFYHAKMNAAVTETLLLENKLRAALEKEQFVLHYQPKLNLTTGQISGLEALIRWNDPDNGLIPPAKFIPLLEETGMILDVGAWAIRKALSDHHRWQVQGLQPPRIAVNVSSIQLRRKDFVDTVRSAISGEKSTPHGLDLEITESLIMDDMESNIKKLASLREMNINIAIDDFGTGYSSLGYLARLPVNLLKIDRSFITTMTKGAESMAIVSTIISLAHSLSMKVVAEGVETEEQSRFLKLLKCDEMQGYLFSKPLPAEQLTRMLETRSPSPR
jgi:diguanylate cyclase (GGDEF)-like protein/PAS domain S-box-containing protein